MFQDESYCNRNPCDSNLPTGESFGKTIDFHFSNCYVTNVSDVFLETVIMEMNIYNSAGLYVSRSMQVIYQIFMFLMMMMTMMIIIMRLIGFNLHKNLRFRGLIYPSSSNDNRVKGHIEHMPHWLKKYVHEFLCKNIITCRNVKFTRLDWSNSVWL